MATPRSSWLQWLNPRRRLFAQVYLAFVGIVVLLVVLAGLAFGVLDGGLEDHQKLKGAVAIAAALLPDPQAPPAKLREALAHWHEVLGVDISVFSSDTRWTAAAGPPVPFPDLDDDERAAGGFVRFRRAQAVAGGRLDDGRWVLLRDPREGAPRGPLGLVALALAIGLGAYPVARRMAGRLERLQARVEAAGRGDLSARVAVEGADEVADLARSFNRAVARIEALVASQRAMLAGASHELRTPLTRIRMAIELLDHGGRTDLHARIAQDIDELDSLIDELLVSSRLESGADSAGPVPVDLLELATQEAARTGATVSGSACVIHGEPRWLARMLRNLLENARRHGGAQVAVHVEPEADGSVRLSVEDDGPGIDPAQLERIFEPFYRPPGLREGRDHGYGLGLALVRQIAARHGGSVSCRAGEAGGTCFEVLLGRPPEPPA